MNMSEREVNVEVEGRHFGKLHIVIGWMEHANNK